MHKTIEIDQFDTSQKAVKLAAPRQNEYSSAAVLSSTLCSAQQMNSFSSVLANRFYMLMWKVHMHNNHGTNSRGGGQRRQELLQSWKHLPRAPSLSQLLLRWSSLTHHSTEVIMK
jgi:hypothetical protein